MIISKLLSQFPNIQHGFGTKDAAIPSDPSPWRAKQIHSDQIVELSFTGDLPPAQSVTADAVMTRRRDLPIAVQTADCVPILMVAPNIETVAAIHAGWRGTAAGIAPKVVRKLVDDGAQAEQLHVAIGPCIAAQNYEVGEDVAKHFVGALLAAPSIEGTPLRKNGNDKYLLDLAAANRYQLIQCGFPTHNIDMIELCTFEDEDLFYSYRRDGKGTGRQISWIQLV